MRWGRFDDEARAAIGTLDKQQLMEVGMDRSLAEAWRDFYHDVKAWDPANPSAAGRADLMDWVAHMLHDV